VSAKIPASSQCADAESGALGRTLNRLVAFWRVIPLGSLRILVFDPLLFFDLVLPCRVRASGSLYRRVGEFAAIEEDGIECAPEIALCSVSCWYLDATRDLTIEISGGPDGIGKPVKDGLLICHDLVRSRLKKSLSAGVNMEPKTCW
jgi:hypothetical protein